MAVSELLGHATVATPHGYLDHLRLGELRAAVPHLPHGTAQRWRSGSAATVVVSSRSTPAFSALDSRHGRADGLEAST